MAIKRLYQIDKAHINKKYGFLPSKLTDMQVGPPVEFDMVRGKRAYYYHLPRKWNTEKKKMEFLSPDDVPFADLENGFCRADDQMIVCDTIEEAIDVYNKSRQLRNDIAEYRSSTTAAFYKSILTKEEE